MEEERREKLAKCTVEPTGAGFARVTVELVRQPYPEDISPPDAVSISVTFNIRDLSVDQIKDFAIKHAKTLMNRCVTDPHARFEE